MVGISTGDMVGLSESKRIDEEEEEKTSLPAGAASSSGGTSTGLAAVIGDRSFSSLKDVVSDKTLKAVGEMGFSDMMEIQYRSIRPLLEGR